MQRLCLKKVQQGWEPRTLRYRLFHVAGRLTRSGRRLCLKLDAHSAHAHDLAVAWPTLRSLSFST